ncbi:hypothetical protein MMC07_006340 [Pseudocyphellaria aurata]|nr:hypothetical protein [Pseudocyphellaria aurata]
MSLANLPLELFFHVGDNIDSQPALCNLAQCSRQFYRCLMPCLYHHVTIHEKTRENELQGKQLEKFASLMIQRPDLARLVRSFTVHVIPVDDDDASLSLYSRSRIPDEPYEVGSEKVRVGNRVFETAVSALELSREEENAWMQRLRLKNRKRYADLMIALLLPALLKVEKLILDLRYEFATFDLGRIIQRAIRRKRPFDVQPLFEALKVIDTHDWYIIQTRGLMASLLQLPAIEVISSCVEGGSRTHKDLSLQELRTSSSPLINLSLTDYNLGSADLHHILRAPKALKTFCFYMNCLPDYLQFKDIRHALEPHKDCLESLGFGSTGEENHDLLDNPRRPLIQPMPSFVDFNMVKMFKTTACFLDWTDAGWGPDRLINIFPPNLETLHLTRFQAHAESLVEALEFLLVRKSPQQMPVLKNLILVETRPDEYDERPMMMDVLWKDTQETVIKTLSRVAKAHGVFIDAIPIV